MTGITLKQTVESLFDIVKDRSTKEELVFRCPQPGCGDESGNRSVNLKSGKTNCFRCNKGGDFVRWARFLGYDITDEGSKQAQPIEELDLSGKRDEATALPLVKSIRLPEGFTYCHKKPRDIYTVLIAEMAERKHLTIEDLFRAKVGFTKVDPKWEPYAIFPVFDYERTVYWQGRTYVDVPGESTKRFPDRQEAPNGAKFWIYGIDELRASRSSKVLVMESILNVLSMRRFLETHGIADIAPVCVFKHYLSKPQFRKLCEIGSVKEVCLLYDHDATRSSWDKSPLLVFDRFPITIAEMPPGPGGEKNDPNDDPEAAWAAFEARKTSDMLTSLTYHLDQPPVKSKARGLVLGKPSSPLEDLGL